MTSSHGHQHAPAGADQVQSLLAALGLILAFLIFEVALAFVSHSLALLADGSHMLVDAFALAGSVWAARLATWPPSASWTFGLKRAEILSAQANGITLLVLSALLLFAAVQRLLNPSAVQGGIVMIVAAVGVAVNLAASSILRSSARESLNVEGSFRHIATDLFAFVATLVAGAVILLTGFSRADAIASLLVVGLMLHSSYSLLRDSGRILLEGGPEDVDIAALASDLAAQPHVAEVHDVHVWTITSGFPALAAHVQVEPGIDCHAVRRNLERLLGDHYGVTHTTLQVDHVTSPPLIKPESLLDPDARHSNTSTPRSWLRESRRPPVG